MKIVIMLLGLVLWVSPSVASNDVIRACSENQQRQIAVAIGEFELETKYRELTDVISDLALDSFVESFKDVNTFQVDWWTEFVPSLPNCSLANELSLIGGRLLDELSIALAIALSAVGESNVDEGLLTITQYHIAEWNTLQTEMITLLEDVISDN